MSAQSHQADPNILGRRTLQNDHKILAGLLSPGLSVLDVGCGIGAITSGIAIAVGPEGRVVGVDRDAGLLNLARDAHSHLSNLTFEQGDATSLSYANLSHANPGHRGPFDIATAARTLQWIPQPARAIHNMKLALKPGGILVILDYNHSRNAWVPEPPREFLHFYRAFLAWREANEWDNKMGDHLPGLFRDAELINVESHPQDEVAERGEAGFQERTAIWSEVIDNVGAQIAGAGFCSASEVSTARDVYGAWAHTALVKQTLTLCCITGFVS